MFLHAGRTDDAVVVDDGVLDIALFCLYSLGGHSRKGQNAVEVVTGFQPADEGA